jgi:hypothetical protein
MTSTECTATTCWAVRGSDPPRCFAHHDGAHNEDRGCREPHDLPAGEHAPGASPIEPAPPPENIDDLFADLAETQATLFARIKNYLAAPDTANRRELFASSLTLTARMPPAPPPPRHRRGHQRHRERHRPGPRRNRGRDGATIHVTRGKTGEFSLENNYRNRDRNARRSRDERCNSKQQGAMSAIGAMRAKGVSFPLLYRVTQLGNGWICRSGVEQARNARSLQGL